MIEVLVVDDSAVVRELLVRILESDPDIRVAGTARNGVKALEHIAKRKPDLVTMDILMPEMDGLEATRAIMASCPVPVIIVSSSWNPGELEKTFLALDAGALAVIDKPTGVGRPGFSEMASRLIRTVKLMSEITVVRRRPSSRRRKTEQLSVGAIVRPQARREIRVLAIGASTGGPPAMVALLSGLPRSVPFTMIVVQHMCRGFISGFAGWLGGVAGFPCSVAENGQTAAPGSVYLAPDGLHLGLDASFRFELVPGEPEHGMMPSVSHLFRSLAAHSSASTIAVLLSGMGRDGAYELGRLREGGACTMAQDAASSVVHGMPGEAIRLGGAEYVLPPDGMARIIAEISLPKHAGTMRVGQNPTAGVGPVLQ